MKLTAEGAAALPTFVRFGKAMIVSRDIDPVYPVLNALIRNKGLDDEQAYWLCFLYVAWYNLPVGWAAFNLQPEMETCDPDAFSEKWPTGIERRANRGGKVKQHIQSYLEALGDSAQVDWYHSRLLPADDNWDNESDIEILERNWEELNKQLQELWGNGRWAAYKHLEILRRVLDVPVSAPVLGNQNSSGPRQGLAWFYGEVEGQDKESITLLDRQGENLLRRLWRAGLEIDIEELETLLCNWNSMVKGKYYIGHDIDEMQEQITHAVRHGILTGELAGDLWYARNEALPDHYRGEMSTWHGVQQRRMVHYQATGKLSGRAWPKGIKKTYDELRVWWV